MVATNRHEHGGRGSRWRAGQLAGDSSLAVHGEVWCQEEKAPWRGKGGHHTVLKDKTSEKSPATTGNRAGKGWSDGKLSIMGWGSCVGTTCWR